MPTKQVQYDQPKQSVITQAETELLGAAELLLTTFKEDSNNKDYANIPEAERLVNNIQALINVLPAFLNTVNTRIFYKSSSWYFMQAAASLEPMLVQLAIVRQILGNLAPLANDMQNLTAQQQQVVVNLRKQINAFVLSLLKDGSVIKQIIEKMNINIPLLLNIGQGGKLVGTGLDNATQSEHVGVFFDYMLTELLCEIPAGFADDGQNTQVKIYKAAIAGKKLEKMDLPARQVVVNVASSSSSSSSSSTSPTENTSSNTVNNSANSSSVLTPPSSSLWSYYVPGSLADVVRLGFVAVAYVAMAIDNSNKDHNNNPPPAPKTLQDVINALQVASKASAEPQDLVDRLILPENLQKLSEQLAALTPAEKQAADAIVKATIQLVVDVKGITIEGFTKTTNIDNIVGAYRKAIAPSITQIAEANRAEINASIKTIIDNINRQAKLLDLLTLLQKSFNAQDLFAQISGASHHFEQLADEDREIVKEIEQEMIQFFINVTTINIPGKTKTNYANFSAAQAAFTDNFKPLLSLLHPQERVIVCAIFCCVLCAMGGAGFLLGFVAAAEITLGMMAGSVFGGMAVGAATGSVVAYRTSSYKAIADENSKNITAAQNSGPASRFTPQVGN